MIYSTDNYYESTLQLRPYNKEVFDFVINEISKNNRVLISKQTKIKYGIDLKLTSRKFTVQIGKKLKNKFGGTLKFSKTLYGVNKQTSRRVYRITVCFRLAKPL